MDVAVETCHSIRVLVLLNGTLMGEALYHCLMLIILCPFRSWDDASVSPIVRQSLLHWAYELTEADFEAMRKGL